MNALSSWLFGKDSAPVLFTDNDFDTDTKALITSSTTSEKNNIMTFAAMKQMRWFDAIEMYITVLTFIISIDRMGIGIIVRIDNKWEYLSCFCYKLCPRLDVAVHPFIAEINFKFKGRIEKERSYTENTVSGVYPTSMIEPYPKIVQSLQSSL